MGIVAKYKFDGSVYADLIPEFNTEFTDYTITDEVDSENSNHIIRTIESDSLPTLMRFGLHNSGNVATDREASLLSIEYLDVSQCTDLAQLCRYCYNIQYVNCGDWDTRNVVNMLWLFEGCNKLKEVDVRNWDTSKCTKIGAIFSGCTSLNSLDLSLWDTNKVINLMYLFASCISLITLDISNMVILEDNSLEGFLTSGCTSLKYIKCNIPDTIQKISSLLPTRTADDPGVIIYQGAETLPQETIDTLNSRGWTVNTNPTLIAKYKYDSKIYKNLIPVFNKGYMGFVEDEEVDENGVVTRVIEHVELPTYMRFGETWETSQNQPTWRSSSLIELLQINDSNIANFSDMFKCCDNLRNVCKLNLNGIALVNTFFRCYNLEKLDLSNNTFSNVENINYIFSECAKLISLDISNFNLNKCRGFDNVFTNNISLKDIGMIYCDQSTINKVASLLPTDHNITIWVESDDILQYDQYDHITYKTQKVQDTVHLNSPLLKGDTIEVIDGKTYHVHRYEKVVLDGSEDWNSVVSQTIGNSYLYQSSAYSGIIVSENIIINILCDKMNTITANENWSNTVLKNGISLNKYGTISIRCENITSVNDLKTWLSNNILNVIAPLVTPYYELISEEPLELTLLDTTDNTINNNSILPSNMTIANKELSTIAIKPSTTYTLSFDKSNVDSEVTIDICGGEQLTTVLNRVELTTPSELGSGIRFISSDGCIISNVRLLEGSLVKEAIPKETFEGLKSSFEDGYIIGEVLGTADSMTLINTKNETQASDDIINLSKFIKAKNPITLIFNTDIANSNVRIGCYGEKGIGSGFYNNIDKLDKIGLTKYLIIPMIDIVSIRLVNHDSDSTKIGDTVKISNVVVLEGDHTHLSEAELMRYIEKGTSHYEEEDFNHVGKYKVQYKVTGKNKFSGYGNITYIKPNTAYKFSSSVTSDATRLNFAVYDKNGNNVGENVKVQNLGGYSTFYFNISTDKFTTGIDSSIVNTGFILQGEFDYIIIGGSQYTNLQLEEGTTVTEYEPYKEDIKTYYLSSPLLEGDTIEDINGVATHVKRYGKVVLDGGNKFRNETTEGEDNITFLIEAHDMAYWNKGECYLKSDRLPGCAIGKRTSECVYRQDSNTSRIALRVLKTRLQTLDTEGCKQWLQENPITVIYPLASPIYETISTESILCDNYVNGHLDVDSAIPIEKVYFIHWSQLLAYLQPSTKYKIQFNSDNVGFLQDLGIGGAYIYQLDVTKGVNIFEITTGANLNHNALRFNGIGFNASNIQVVATDKDIDFDYFKGLQSSFENGLVTDEADENYGKYKVECKIVGKNKFDISNLIVNDNTILSYIDNGIKVKNNKASKYSASYINLDVKPNTTYSISYKSNVISGNSLVDVYDENNKYFYGSYPLVFNTKNNNKIKVNFFCTTSTSVLGDVEYTNIQIEEGTQATPYEPYKESIHTLYLNSPLLKGDKLVVHDGKLCHYHKMGMVVLDDSKDINILDNSNTNTSICSFKLDKIAPSYSIAFCDNFIWIYKYNEDCKHFYISSDSVLFTLEKTKLSSLTVDGWKQWFQQNPTTVVYELAEPYYEPIEPQLSQYSFSTVKDGDMEIITALPIEKINLTYRTDINGVSSIEEQIASIQEGTDISSIIDEEVDE